MSISSKHRTAIICLFLSLANPVWSNENSHSAIMSPITLLFDGMREGNGDKVRAAFANNAVMTRAHATLHEGGTPEKFAQAVENKPENQIWDEHIWDIQIQQDDKLASVWTQFAFYLDDKLSHCGVNSFQLYKFEEGWKIIYLVDTFRQDDCNAPAESQ